LDGDKAKTKWVFWGGSGNYFVGSFDGTAFHPETESIRSNFGNTGYAAQTFYNDPRGRRVQISWHNGSTFPGAPWNQELGFPTELRLVSTAAGPRLTFRPVDEIKKLRVWRVDPPYDVASGLMDIFLQIRPSSSGQLALAANGHEIHFDATNWTLSALDKSVKLEPLKGLLKLRILADRASIEVFAQDGLVSMPLFALPISDAKHGLRIEAPDDWKVEKSEVWELKSSWQP
jgi:fructan beta-fructosidase